MTAAVSHRTSCRLCGSPDLELVLPLAPTPLADAYITADQLDVAQPLYPLDVYWCRACAHVQLLDVVDPEILFRDYIYSTASSPGLVAHFERYAQDILARCAPAPDALAVDIGSNDGSLLRFFKTAGLRVQGVDPATDVASGATASGIPTIPAFFTRAIAERILREQGPASIVTANNVYAHVDDLASLTAGIRALLAPDGVFVFEVSYLVDLLDNMVFDWIYHEHIDYHHIAPLRRFFERLDLQLLDVTRVGTKGGSIRVVVQRADGPRRPSPSVAEFIGEEQRRGLDRVDPYLQFAQRIDAVGQQVADLVTGMRRKGQRLAAYGASATTTTLLYHFRVGESLDCLIDDNESRQGRFSPGLHLPVRPSSILYDQTVDAVLVCAWRFVDPIAARHQAYLERGGRFIVPLPELVCLPQST